VDTNSEKRKLEIFDRTLQLIDSYGQEAKRCRSAGAYFAGCVMLGAAAEAALILFLHSRVYDTAWSENPDSEFGKHTKLGLAKLLELIRGWGWLNQDESRERNELNPCLDGLRLIRNLVHPGFCLRDPPKIRIDADQFDSLHNAVAQLLDYIDEIFVQDIEENVRTYRSLGKTAVSMFGPAMWTAKHDARYKEMEAFAKEARAQRSERRQNWLWKKTPRHKQARGTKTSKK